MRKTHKGNWFSLVSELRDHLKNIYKKKESVWKNKTHRGESWMTPTAFSVSWFLLGKESRTRKKIQLIFSAMCWWMKRDFIYETDHSYQANGSWPVYLDETALSIRLDELPWLKRRETRWDFVKLRRPNGFFVHLNNNKRWGRRAKKKGVNQLGKVLILVRFLRDDMENMLPFLLLTFSIIWLSTSNTQGMDGLTKYIRWSP